MSVHIKNQLFLPSIPKEVGKIIYVDKSYIVKALLTENRDLRDTGRSKACFA